jgi:type I restriction enzyme S subunit
VNISSLLKGSLMLGMYDSAALKASVAGVDCSCNQAVAFSQLDCGRSIPTYVYYTIRIGREHFRRLQRGVRQKNLNLSMVREIAISLPPLDLQRHFASRAAAVDELKASHHASLVQLDALFASLQHRAFRGEL